MKNITNLVRPHDSHQYVEILEPADNAMTNEPLDKIYENIERRGAIAIATAKDSVTQLIAAIR